MQQAGHIEQLARIQRTAAVSAQQNRPYLTDATERRTAVPDHTVFRIRRLIHPDLRLFMVIEWPQRTAFRLGCVRRSLRGQPLKDFIIFQCF